MNLHLLTLTDLLQIESCLIQKEESDANSGSCRLNFRFASGASSRHEDFTIR